LRQIKDAAAGRWQRARVHHRHEVVVRKLALSLVLVPGVACAQDVVQGKALAERWCANCHVVSGSATAGSANGLPTFPALAGDPGMTEAKLRAAMTAQHGRMPDLQLTRHQQDDLVAYILSLKSR
jgi:mono/diheme cytochrome c family protein